MKRKSEPQKDLKMFQADRQPVQQICIFRALGIGQCGWSIVKERERQGQKVMKIK